MRRLVCILLTIMVVLLLCSQMIIVGIADTSVRLMAASPVAGICGENLRWVFNGIDNLTITGNGEMAFDEVPWIDYSGFITTIEFPNGITSIDEDTFKDCTSLESIVVDSENEYYTSDDGVLFDRDKKKLIQYPIGNNRETYDIPYSVTCIGKNAFYNCTYLKEINYAGKRAEWKMIDIEVGNDILEKVIVNCKKTQEILNPPSASQPSGEVPYGTEIELKKSGGHLAYQINDGVVQNSYFNVTLTITEDTTITAWTQTSALDPDVEYIMPQSTYTYTVDPKTIPLKAIEVLDNGKCGQNIQWTLYSSGELTITGTGEMDDYISSKNLPWNNSLDKIKSVKISYGVENVGDFSFNGCVNLENVEIGESVTSIGESAFVGCKNLLSVKMPYELTQIGRSAFRDCSSITEFHVPKGIIEIKDNTFYCCISLSSLYLPSTVVKIGNSTFNGCTSLSTVYYEGTEDVFYNSLEISDHNMPLLESYVECNYIEPVPQYQISYYVDGIRIKSQEKKYGENVTLTDYIPQKSNSEFVGWSTKMDDETAEYVSKDEFDENIDVNLYAVWKKRLFSVTSSLPSGAYFNSGVSKRKFYLSCDNEDADIYYTTDGTEPTNESTLYDGEWITLTDSITLKAVAYLDGELFSEIAEYKYIYDTNLYVVEGATIDAVEIEQGGDINTVLPKTVKLKTSNNDTINATIEWATENCSTNDVGGLSVKGTILLSDSAYSWFDEDYKNVTCIVNVKEKATQQEDSVLYGDINGDKKVDMKDATRLLKYLSNWEVDIVEKASDLNADGKIDMKDATRLLKHLAGWEGELGVK